MDEILNMARIAYDALIEKKAEDVNVIDISGISTIADYFVIASGKNDNQMRTLVDNVEEKMGRAGYTAKMREGTDGNVWVLLDYGDVIVHIFGQKDREFYDLDRIWRDGKEIHFEDDGKEIRFNQESDQKEEE